MALYCVDASFVVAWLVPSQGSPSVEAKWTDFADGIDEFVGPPLLYAETVSALRKLGNRRLLEPAEERGFVQDFLDLAIPTQEPSRLYHRAHLLAMRYGQPTAYDCCYLALADYLGSSLLTLDKRFYNAVSEDFPNIVLLE